LKPFGEGGVYVRESSAKRRMEGEEGEDWKGRCRWEEERKEGRTSQKKGLNQDGKHEGYIPGGRKKEEQQKQSYLFTNIVGLSTDGTGDGRGSACLSVYLL
jgi:hypothetical protein